MLDCDAYQRLTAYLFHSFYFLFLVFNKYFEILCKSKGNRTHLKYIHVSIGYIYDILKMVMRNF